MDPEHWVKVHFWFQHWIRFQKVSRDFWSYLGHAIYSFNFQLPLSAVGCAISPVCFGWGRVCTLEVCPQFCSPVLLPHPTEGWITQPVLQHQRRFSLLSTGTNRKELSQQQGQAQVRPQDHFCLQSTDFASPSVSPQCQPGCGHPVWCPRAQPGWPATATALRGAAVAGQLLDGCLAMPAMILITYSTAQI